MVQATWAPRNSQGKTWRIALATGAIGCCGCVLSMLSGFGGIPTAQAFANALQPQAVRGDKVARGVRFNKDFAHQFKGQRGEWTAGFKDKTDDELHKEIAQARKEQFEFRLDVFRRRNPEVGSRLYKAQWKVVAAKEILNQRRIEKYRDAFNADLKANDVKAPMASKWTEEMQINAFQSYWQKPSHRFKKDKWYGHKENVYPDKITGLTQLKEEIKGPGERGNRQQLIDRVKKFEKEKGIEAKRRAASIVKRLSLAPARRSRKALEKIKENETSNKAGEEAKSEAPPTATAAFGNSRSTSRSTSQLPLAGGAVAISALTAALFASGRRRHRGGRA